MSENIIEHPQVHLQAGLTKVHPLVTTEFPTQNQMARLRMARVLSVDRRRGQVKVTGSSSTGNSITNTGGQEETVQLPVHNYGINTTGDWYGDFPSVGVGDRVLVAHINSNAGLPIVLGVYPDANMMKHITPTDDYENKHNNNPVNFDDFRAQKKVFPSQHVELHTGTGNYEHSLDGYSAILALNPGDTTNREPSWRNDYYTGLPEDYQHGTPLECFKDKESKDSYNIQNDQAQDWVKIHQSNTLSDKHITKQMITQDGRTHNFWGSRNFKNDALTEDVSPSGYKIRRRAGKNDVGERQDRVKLIKAARKAVGHHPYTRYTPDNIPAKVERSRKYHFNDEIEYVPKDKHSGTDDIHFIWTLLKHCGYPVPKNLDKWADGNLLASDMHMKHEKPKKATKGDIALIKDTTKTLFESGKPHEHRRWTSITYIFPVLLTQNYHGSSTKVIGAFPFHIKKVAEITIGRLLKAIRRKFKGTHNTFKPVFYHLPHILTSGSHFGIDDENKMTMGTKDPNIVGSGHSNGMVSSATGSHIKTNGHTIGMDKSGFKIDGSHLDDIIDSKTKPLKKQIKRLTHSLNTLVYNLNDRHSRLSQHLFLNQELNGDKKNPPKYHDYDESSAAVPNRQTNIPPSEQDIDTAKKHLKLPYKEGGTSLVDGADSSGFVYEVLRVNGSYKVPKSRYNTETMRSDPASCDFIPINQHITQAGDVFVTPLHCGFLLEPYHGFDTKVINEGGAKSNVNISTMGEADDLDDAKDYVYLRPIPKVPYHKLDNILPNDNDTLKPTDAGQARVIGNPVERGAITWCNEQDYSINQTAGILASIQLESGFGKNNVNYLGVSGSNYSRNIGTYLNQFSVRIPAFSKYSTEVNDSAFGCGKFFSRYILKDVANDGTKRGNLAERIAKSIRPKSNINK